MRSVKMLVSAVLGAAVLLAGCNGMKPAGPSDTSGQHIAFGGYEPVEPDIAPWYTGYNKDGVKQKTLWAGKKTKEIRELLPLQTSSTVIKRYEAGGKITYFSAMADAKVGFYEVIMDYSKYRMEDTVADDNDAGNIKVGVGVRIRAKVWTSEAGVNLNSLLVMGGEARGKRLSGTLTVDVIGIDSQKMVGQLPVGVQFDETSLQTTLQTLAAIQTRIHDDDAILTPHVLALKQATAPPAEVTPATTAKRVKLLDSFKKK